MEIQNLEINILYCMCNPLKGRIQDGTSSTQDIVDEFSDIPPGNILTAIQSMVKERLITIDRSGARIAITQNGINRLQSSLACRIHQFDSCRCGRAT